MRSYHSAYLLTVLCLCSVLVVACDSSGSNGGGSDDSFSLDKGSFTLKVTEDGTTSEFSGGAVFGIGSDAASSGGEAFVVYMLDGKKTLQDNGDVGGTWTEMIIRDRQDVKIPSQGDWEISRWDMNSRDLSSFYGTSGGTVQIMSSSNSELKGSFSYSAFGATVEGSFTAKKTDKANTVICAPDCKSS